MFGRKKSPQIELTSLSNEASDINDIEDSVPTTGKLRYAIVRPHKYGSNKDNIKNILTSKSWDNIEGYFDAEIKDVVSYIEKISTVDYKFGDGEVLIRYEIIPVKHESKLTHEYKIGE